MERSELNLTLVSFARATLVLFASLSYKQHYMAVFTLPSAMLHMLFTKFTNNDNSDSRTGAMGCNPTATKNALAC
jgi:hypothetical protein